jgi:hypothetical protein
MSFNLFAYRAEATGERILVIESLANPSWQGIEEGSFLE